MSVTGEIEKLEAMRKAGTLSDAEFAEAKRRVLEAKPTPHRSWMSFDDWLSLPFVVLAVVFLAALGVLIYADTAGEGSAVDGTPSLIALVVVFACLVLSRPVLGYGFWGFGGGEEVSYGLLAVVGIGALAGAGALFVLGLPFIAIGIGGAIVVGFVLWVWAALFGGG